MRPVFVVSGFACSVACAFSQSSNSAGASQAVPRPQPVTGAVQVPMPALVPDTEKLTLNQALQIGLLQNPQIASAQSSVQSAKENFYSQRSPINPTVDYAALNNTVAPISWTHGFGEGTNYSVYATVETNGAITYRTRQAREQFHQAQFDALTTGLSLKLSIIDAYVGLQAANRALEVELKVLENMGKLYTLTKERFETGAGAQADATRAKIAEIQEEQNVITDVDGVNQARATLNGQLGRPQQAPVDAAEALVYKPIAAPGLDQLIAQAERDRPELKSAIANLHSLQAVPGLQRAAYFPDVILARDFGDEATFYIGLSIPLDLGSIGHAIKKAEADVKTQEAQIELQKQNIDLDVKSSYENFVAAQKQVDTYNSGVMQLSQTLLDQMRHGYQLGANSIVDLITAENTYRSVESSYYAALGIYVQAAFTLKHSIGALPDQPTGEDLNSITFAGPPLQQANRLPALSPAEATANQGKGNPQ